MQKKQRMLFNLIVTNYPGYDNYVLAKTQLQQALENIQIIDSRQSLMLILVDDPYRSIEIIREKIRGETPLLRVIPVDAITDVYVDRVAKAVKEVFSSKVPKDNTFKVEIDGRLFMSKEGEVIPLHTMEAIEQIASLIDNPVNVRNPDYLVYIKTLRLYRVTELATITVCKPNQILRYAAGIEQ
jgi:tRNA acetyltransferase TAN1